MRDSALEKLCEGRHPCGEDGEEKVARSDAQPQHSLAPLSHKQMSQGSSRPKQKCLMGVSGCAC